jgi:hypothetical protein
MRLVEHRMSTTEDRQEECVGVGKPVKEGEGKKRYVRDRS